MTRFRIDGSDVASLPDVAPEAGIGEVLNLGASAVLPADDVVYLVGKVSVVLMQQAVLAAVSGAFRDELTQLASSITRQVESAAWRGPWPSP